MMKNQNLVRIVEHALPALSGSSVHYDANRNMICTSSYTSSAGNSYYQGIRLSDRLVINIDLGQGYSYLFMNGLKLYCFDGRNKKMIGSRFYHSCSYSDCTATKESEEILFHYLKSQSGMIGASVSDRQLHEFARVMVLEAMNNNIKGLK
ncbi:MAG: hypothetical protein ACI392_07165 [Paludibacteraceae bacterium]